MAQVVDQAIIEVTAKDKATPVIKNVGDTMRKEAAKTTSAIKSQESAFITAGKKYNEQVKELAFRFVGLTAGVKVVQMLGQSILDAGLKTEGVNNVLGRLSATIGKELLPQAQDTMDAIAAMGDGIIVGITKTVQVLKAVFESASAAITGLTSLAITALGKITRNQDWVAYGKALGESTSQGYLEAWTAVYSKVNIQSPKSVATTGKASGKVSGGAKGDSGDSMLSEFKRISDIKIKIQQEEATRITDIATKQRETLRLKQLQEVFDAQGNGQILADLKKLHAQEQISLSEQIAADEVAIQTEKQRQLQEIAMQFREEAIAAIPDEWERKRAEMLLQQEMERQDYAGNLQALDELKTMHEYKMAKLDDDAAASKKELEKQVLKQKVENAKKGLAVTVDSLKTAATQFKEFAGAYKAVAIAQAIWDTYGAANAAFNSMAKIPYVGYALGAAAAAATIVAGLANVKQIATTKFARGGEFTTNGPETIMVGDNPGGRERVSVTPISSPNTEGPRGNGASIIVNIQDATGNIIDSFTRAIRSGAADRLVDDLRVRMAI